ncbi:short-chain dehydrogenase/reductase SDR [Cladophialophora carrionii]|uniref:Short-chain dehydrogenase/reductase SDR n=1 Tax=Cladophialophora carrionii TaxID=86049 RepID=A0A1C1CVQ5_9EURO|nr:short-chain dehydrogenase/reductase SDR [Cladophialophora carrionii]
MVLQGESRIVISGAGQGIGRALARHFASSGHKIFILDLNKDNVRHTAEVHLKEHADRVGWSACNLRDVDEIRSTVQKAVKFLDNRIDYLINNAGISYPYWPDGKTMEDPSVMDKWNAYVETNLTGPFVMSQACLPYMKVKKQEDKQKLPESTVGTAGPCIIHMSSFRAMISDPNQEGYASTKGMFSDEPAQREFGTEQWLTASIAALLGLTQSMAVSLQSFGVRVNMVSPGRIKVTHENQEADESGTEWKAEEDDIETHPANRAGLPEDITEACEYLMGAGFVTGQNLIVDGGVSKVKGKA